jgi:hypothetical protein
MLESQILRIGTQASSSIAGIVCHSELVFIEVISNLRAKENDLLALFRSFLLLELALQLGSLPV